MGEVLFGPLRMSTRIDKLAVDSPLNFSRAISVFALLRPSRRVDPGSFHPLSACRPSALRVLQHDSQSPANSYVLGAHPSRAFSLERAAPNCRSLPRGSGPCPLMRDDPRLLVRSRLTWSQPRRPAVYRNKTHFALLVASIWVARSWRCDLAAKKKSAASGLIVTQKSAPSPLSKAVFNGDMADRRHRLSDRDCRRQH